MNMYKKIETSEELPLKGGYYALEMSGEVFGNVHWSVEKQEWTMESGIKMESTYPQYWLKEVES